MTPAVSWPKMRGGATVPYWIFNVGGANAASCDFHQQFMPAAARHRHRFQAKVVRAAEDHGPHLFRDAQHPAVLPTNPPKSPQKRFRALSHRLHRFFGEKVLATDCTDFTDKKFFPGMHDSRGLLFALFVRSAASGSHLKSVQSVAAHSLSLPSTLDSRPSTPLGGSNSFPKSVSSVPSVARPSTLDPRPSTPLGGSDSLLKSVQSVQSVASLGGLRVRPLSPLQPPLPVPRSAGSSPSQLTLKPKTLLLSANWARNRDSGSTPFLPSSVFICVYLWFKSCCVSGCGIVCRSLSSGGIRILYPEKYPPEKCSK